MSDADLSNLLASPPGPPLIDGSPTFGVAITAYQIAHLLPRALRSVIGQSFRPDAIVVCDDGSRDDVDAVVAPFGQMVRLIRQENQGAAGAKNTAIEACGTDYVVLLDGDDYWQPQRLERLRDVALHRRDLALVTTDALVDRGSAIEERTYYEASGFDIAMNDVRTSILRNNFVFSHAMVHVDTWRRSGRFDTRLRGSSDRDCWTRLILDGARVGVLMEPLAVFVHRSGSTSDNRSAVNHGRALMFRKVLERPDLTEDERRMAEAGFQRNQAMALMIDAHAAIARQQPRARRRCWAVARSSMCPTRARAKAAVMASLPIRAARWFASVPSGDA